MDIIQVKDTIYQTNPTYSGSESKIYQQDEILYKIFKTNNNTILKNKIRKLDILYSLAIEDITPLFLIEINNQIKGYATKNIIGATPLDVFQGNAKEKLQILKQILLKLNILHQHNIVFGDISTNNILIKNGAVYFCDYDNYKVENYYFDQTNYLEKIYLQELEGDSYLDNYMFNLLTIAYLEKIFEPYTLNYLRNYTLPNILNTKENKEIAYEMLSLKYPEKITPFIEHTKRYHLF